ncbi:hypothetical protein DKX38_026386 [Salix brachista]|uniref:Uncharacterized protein n=1 Tax=Salix brachista TaxID=2182728 RepID=A0A5N5J9C5_9ROSI|nr:hypothetical protein DKX38_026386 [Salix brachista]
MIGTLQAHATGSHACCEEGYSALLSISFPFSLAFKFELVFNLLFLLLNLDQLIILAFNKLLKDIGNQVEFELPDSFNKSKSTAYTLIKRSIRSNM